MILQQNSTDVMVNYFYDEDNVIQPIDVLYEKHIINPNGLIQLKNIPSPLHTVFTIIRRNGTSVIQYNKVESVVNQYDFMVDYINGILTFHSSQVGKEIQISYTNSIGKLNISADVIFTNTDNQGNIVQTLGTMIDEGRSVLSDLSVLGGASKVITELQGYIESARELTGNIIQGSNINTELKKSTDTAKSTNTTLSSTITNANNKISDLNSWVESHGDIVNLDNRVGTAEDKLNTVSASLEESMQKLSMLDMNKNLEIRRNSNKKWSKYSLPTGFEGFPINIITNGYSFKHDFDITKYKNSGGRTFYVSPNGNGSASVSGLEESNPIWFSVCLTRTNEYALQDGDTVVFLDGIYKEMSRFATLSNIIGKNINLVAKNKGKVAYTSVGSELTYTKNTTYNNVYQVSRSNVLKVVQLLDENDFDTHTPLEKVNSIAECNSKQGSYYIDSSNVLYLRLFFDKIPTFNNTFVLLNYGKSLIDVDSSSQNVKLYIEGIKFFGGTPATLIFSTSTSYKESCLYAKDCDFLYAYDSTLVRDSVSIRGAKSAYFVNCSAQHSSKDGFNYHILNGVIPNFIEINCIGANNGIDGVANSKDDKWQNGSTAHDGVKGIRIGGKYFNNYGGNVADVHEGTITVNILCDAFDSAYNGTNLDAYADFVAQQSGTTMYLESCRAFGSKTSAKAVTGATINVNNCILENGIG